MLNSHKSAFALVAILAVVALAVGGVATYVGYRAHLDEEANRLREMAQSQARLMESVARFDARYINDFLGGPGSATIAQIRDAHANYRGFGRTGEFTLARLEGGQIVFILSHRHHDLDEPQPIPMNSRWAEPMRRALNRLSGTLIGLDYRGETVLAAHEPVDILGLGIVAKIDMTEIREPFLRALGLACLVGTGLISMGGFLFFRITGPLIKAINTSEARFRGTFNQAAVGIAHVAPNGSWLEVNQKLCDIVGYTRDELLARTFQDITHPDDLDADLNFVRQVLAGERETYSMEKRYFHKCGDIVWINLTVSLVRDEHRAPNYFISVIEDISDRKQAEDGLREREQFINRALNASLTGIYIYNLEKGHNDYINSRYTSLTGYCLDDIGRMTPEQFAGLFHPEDRERIFAHREKVAQAEDDDVVEIEYRFRTRDGRWIWCLSWDSVFDRNREGKVRRFIGTFLDITERKRAKAALTQERDFAESLIETAPVIVLVLDPEGHIIRFNSFMEELSGYSLAEVKGQSWFDTFLIERDVPQVADRFAEAMGGCSTCGNLNAIMTREGTERLIAWYDTTLRDTAGNLIALLAIGLDVTEQKAKESQLLQAQKMEMVGQLTGGIAHDFNNLLTVILGNLKLLAKAIGPQCDADATELLDDSLSAAQDGAELTQRLLAFSRTKALRRKRIDLPAFLNHFQRFLRRTLGAEIIARIDIAADADLHYLVCDPTQLESALLNLALNARDAMPQGGQLRFRAEVKAAADLDPTLEPGTYVALAVIDTGEGMTVEQLARAIEPFYTTKESKQGSGLGLSMVFGFCEQAGGRFQLASEPGVGTRATIILPLNGVGGQQATQAPESVPPAALTEKGTILVVEDEERILKLARRYLEDLGYAVLTAENGEMAIAALESEPAIVLVFSDIVMPGKINGCDLYRWVKELRPGVQVLLTTGLRSAEIKELTKDDASPMPVALLKPYTKEQLADAIRDASAHEANGMILRQPHQQDSK